MLDCGNYELDARPLILYVILCLSALKVVFPAFHLHRDLLMPKSEAFGSVLYGCAKCNTPPISCQCTHNYTATLLYYSPVLPVPVNGQCTASRYMNKKAVLSQR